MRILFKMVKTGKLINVNFPYTVYCFPLIQQGGNHLSTLSYLNFNILSLKKEYNIASCKIKLGRCELVTYLPNMIYSPPRHPTYPRMHHPLNLPLIQLCQMISK